MKIEYNYTDPTKEEILSYIKDPSFFKCPENIGSREYSIVLDKILGFKIEEIEDELSSKYRAYNQVTQKDKEEYQGTQAWIGLHPQILQTPYSEIAHFLSILKEYDPKTFIDLGAGYGRVGIVMNAYVPDAKFLGYEIVESRLDEGKRVLKYLGLKNCEMIAQDILNDSFTMPKASVYFIYDFSDPADIRIILKRLSENFFKEDFFIIAKGNGIRSIIQNKFPEFWSLNGAIHEGSWSLYSSFCELN